MLVVNALKSTAKIDPDRETLCLHGARLSAATLWGLVDATVARLEDDGLVAGDRILVVGTNTLDFVVNHLAVLAAGGVSVPIPPTSDLDYYVKDADVRVVLTDTGMQHRNPELPPSPDLISLLYTTGSTGLPKAVMIGRDSFNAAMLHILTGLGYNGTQRELIVLPLSHSFGLGHLYSVWATGGLAWVLDGFGTGAEFFEALPWVNGMPMTPSLLRVLMKPPYRERFITEGQHLRTMVVNSERLPPELAQDVLDAFPDLRVWVYYGLTEASRSTFNDLRASGRLDSVGRPADRVEVGIDRSEVCIRGPHLSPGYWRRPQDTALAFRNGWLYTGDTGELDGDGYLTLTGRKDDQINVGGLKVSAATVERVVRGWPGVEDVAVIGLPDEGRGEVAGCAVVGGRDVVFAVRARCVQYLEPHQVPQVIQRISAIPRADTGKLLRGKLREMLT